MQKSKQKPSATRKGIFALIPGAPSPFVNTYRKCTPGKVKKQ